MLGIAKWFGLRSISTCYGQTCLPFTWPWLPSLASQTRIHCWSWAARQGAHSWNPRAQETETEGCKFEKTPGYVFAKPYVKKGIKETGLGRWHPGQNACCAGVRTWVCVPCKNWVCGSPAPGVQRQTDHQSSLAGQLFSTRSSERLCPRT